MRLRTSFLLDVEASDINTDALARSDERRLVVVCGVIKRPT